MEKEGDEEREGEVGGGGRQKRTDRQAGSQTSRLTDRQTDRGK